MRVIDDDGRLFGLVNVVDALAVLLVLAVVVAGVALLDPFEADGDETEPATRYATVDFGSEHRYLAAAIEPGDRMQPRGWDGNATIRDVYRAPAEGTNVTLVARVELEGRLVDAETNPGRTFAFAGEQVSAGSPFAFDAGSVRVGGTVEDLSTNGSTLRTATTQVVVESTVPAATASAIEPGDATTIAGDRVAAVEEVAVYPTNDSETKRVHVGLSLRTLDRQGVATFAGEQVKVGTPLALDVTDYDLRGTTISRGRTAPPGDPVTRTVEVEVANVSPATANAVEPGLTEESHGTTYARVLESDVRPTRVVLTSDDGNIYEREHPRKRTVAVTVELTARSTPAGLRFHGRALQEGGSITLDLGPVTVHGEVVDVRDA